MTQAPVHRFVHANEIPGVIGARVHALSNMKGLGPLIRLGEENKSYAIAHREYHDSESPFASMTMIKRTFPDGTQVSYRLRDLKKMEDQKEPKDWEKRALARFPPLRAKLPLPGEVVGASYIRWPPTLSDSKLAPAGAERIEDKLPTTEARLYTPSLGFTPFSTETVAAAPSSPIYRPSSPVYAPSSPIYAPSSPVYTSSNQLQAPSSPIYAPSSPEYNMPHALLDQENVEMEPPAES